MTLLLSLVNVALATEPDSCNQSPPAPGHIEASGKVVYGAIDPTPSNKRSGDEHVGVCELDPSNNYTLLEVDYCTPWSSASTPLNITDAGDSTSTTIAPVVNPAGKVCKDAAGNAVTLYPFADYFVFGLWFTGYCGRDKVYGTQGRDYLHSQVDPPLGTTVPLAELTAGSPCPAMTGPELLCGYGGNDKLMTQTSSASPATYGVCADAGTTGGGAENDVCHVTSAYAIDAALHCETESGEPGFDPCDCGCGSAPSDAFFPSYVP